MPMAPAEVEEPKKPTPSVEGERRGVSTTRNILGGVLLLVLTGAAGIIYYDKFGKKEETAAQTNTPSDDKGTLQPLELLPLPGDPVAAGVPGANPKAKGGGKAKDVASPALAAARIKLVGTWQRAEPIINAGVSEIHAVEYRADGTFSYTVTAESKPVRSVTGRWTAASGNDKKLVAKVTVADKPDREVGVTFQDDGISQPRLDVAENGDVVFTRKK